jgi:hypothetical protein
MLTVLGNPRRFCNGVTRRDALKAGGLGLLGGFFGLPTLPEVQAVSNSSRQGRAKSIIFIFLHGGAATQDMFDLKPNAPAQVRGEFRPIATSAAGIQICEHLPRMAGWMHKAVLVRSVNHRAGCHNVVPTFSGHAELVPEQNIANPNHPPSMGSVCEYLRQGRGNRRDDMPAYVCVPNYLGWGEAGRRPGIYGGFLGQRYDPLSSECNPHYDAGVNIRDRGKPAELRGQPTVPNGILQPEITLDRLNHRQTLLHQLDVEARRLDGQLNIGQYSRTRERAFSMLTSRKLRQAFDLDHEDPRLRDRYGRTLFGASMLTARKLVEAGVQFTNVFWDNYAPRFNSADFGWDTHELNFITLRERYLPWLDRSYSALIEDLECRGLLDETLVVMISDFGRTPHVNKDAGRDHWSYCYTVMLAGAGIRGGTVYGSSDHHAAFVRDNPVSPADICATLYECLGIDSEMLIHDRAGRPVTIAQGGRAVREILA